MSKLIVIDKDSGMEGDYKFFCPGCKWHHLVWTTTRNHNQCLWEFNGDIEKPTFSPSLLIRWGDGNVCHSFINNGMIQFLPDCTHTLAGKTVELPDINNQP